MLCGLPTPISKNKVSDDELPSLVSKYSVLLDYATTKKRNQVLGWPLEEQYDYLYKKYYNEKAKLKKEGKVFIDKGCSSLSISVDGKVKTFTKIDGRHYINWICENGCDFDMSVLTIEELTKLTKELTAMQEYAGVVLECKLEEKAAMEKKMVELQNKMDALTAKYKADKEALEEQMSELRAVA